MPLLAKIDPSANPGITMGEIVIHARQHHGSEVNSGDEIFVWTSEDEGGDGLVALAIARGSVEAFYPNKTTDGEHREIKANIEVIRQVTSRLTKRDLTDHRTNSPSSPIEEISREIYYFSHNHFSQISEDAARELRRRFI